MPSGAAVAGFIGYVVAGVADIITLVAAALPWAVVSLPIVWLIARARRRARAVDPSGPTPR